MHGGYWSHPDPNNHGGKTEDCMATNINHNGRFLDITCSRTFIALCQLIGINGTSEASGFQLSSSRSNILFEVSLQ